jgi:alkanesulfonate monooxygenase SsuD/methylene tetrahydromethanopterin reductase-like flavin-dependent oxidoreductase (luciferase family)
MFGAQLLNQRTSWLEIKSVLAVMEAGPWTSVYTYDHFIPPLSPTAEILEHDQWDTLEGWALLAAVAAVTTKLKLGVLVSGTTYRNPALLAKMAATIDEVSGGRAILGIGAGWNVREHEAYGWAFPSMKERSDRLEEACAVIQKLFNSDALVDYDGKYYQLKQAPFAPRGVNGKIPLMVGGTGPKRTLKTLAMYGDQMNVIAGPEDLKRARATLAEHCAAIGRDPNEISSTVHVPIRIVNDEKAAKEQRGEKTWSLIGPKQWVIDRCGDFIDVGVDEFCFMSIRQRPEVYQELTEEVLSAFN